MCGAYTDNQPDFSWLQPGEEKRFTQTFMPFKTIGGATNASQDAVINLEIAAQGATIGVYLTRPRRVTIQLINSADAAPLFEDTVDLSPETAFTQTVPLPADLLPESLSLRVLDGDHELIASTPLPDQPVTIPQPARAAQSPSEIASNEELFLNGLHLEQYRHATYAPEPYYLEALRRDPLDSRCNNAMGLLLLRRGKFAEAEAYFRTAVESLTRRNPNPYDGEPYYHLGIALKLQGRFDDAFDAFYKAVWSAAWQDSGYFELARLASRRRDFTQALDRVERALARNQYHHQAQHLKIALLRRLNRIEEAAQVAELSLRLDPLNFGALCEQWLLDGGDAYREFMQENDTVALSLDYAHAGLFEEAAALLSAILPSSADPLVGYYIGWYWDQAGDADAARQAFESAAQLPPDYGFPQRIELVLALECALRYQPGDAHAPYYLGNFWYGHRRHQEAIAAWERSRDLDPGFPTVWRNLGLAYVNQRGDLTRALDAYTKAFQLDPTDARVLFELDQLFFKLSRSPAARLSHLNQHPALVAQRDDLTLQYVTLLNLTGRHGDALDLLLARRFHPWEGGEGKVTGQYLVSLLELARACIQQGDYPAAVDLLQRAKQYPDNLGEGKLYGARENHLDYYLGCACEGMGDSEAARRWFERAASGQSELAAAAYYNDQPPDLIFYQGLALQKLGQAEAACAIFERLIAYGTQHLDDAVTMDYFAVSLPDFLVFDQDLSQQNRIYCHYLIGLGELGLGHHPQAKAAFDAALSLNAAHVGAALHRRLCD